MSKKKTPPSYTEPFGPSIVDTHSYKLSPLGPALKADWYIHETTTVFAKFSILKLIRKNSWGFSEWDDK